jgi:heterodisulfide reductase subunit A
MAEVLSLDGAPPHMKATIRKKPRYVDESKCTGCGACMAKCPTKVPDPYNKGLSTTKAIRIPFPQAVPALAVMDAACCLYHLKGKCGVCKKVCPAGAIDFTQREEVLELEVGAVVLACGTREFDARLKGEYGYGLFPNVLTSLEFERILSASGPTGGHVLRPSDKAEPKRVAILQCVGSRDTAGGNPGAPGLSRLLHAGVQGRHHRPRARAGPANDDLLHGHSSLRQGIRPVR